MKKMMKKSFLLALLVIVTFAMVACGKMKKKVEVKQTDYLAGVDENKLNLYADGSLIEQLYYDYKDQEIDTSDLENFARTKVDDYNQQVGVNRVMILDFRAEGKIIKIAVQYADIDSYNNFNKLSNVLGAADVAEMNQIAAVEAASKADAEVVKKDDVEVSEDELAEAGITKEEYERQQKEKAESQTTPASATDAVATLSDASGSVSNADSLTLDGYMMLITEAPYNYNVNEGTIYYVNRHAKLNDDGSATTDGKGKAVIVFKYNY